jgi:methanogenic corrinoid protein MtbC1
VDTFLASLSRSDRAGALEQVRTLRGEGHDVLTLVNRLLGPAQRRVGDLWVSDDWSVAQEHAATAISETVLAALAAERDAHATPPPDAPWVIVSCVEQEWHALPALMVAEHLRSAGFAVSYLGANSPAQGLVRHVHDLGPRAVLLSCSLSAFLPLARREIEAVRETGTPVVVGGPAFDADGHRARTLGATAFAAAAPGVGDVVRGLPSAVPPAPPLTHAGAEEAYAVFGDRERLSDEVDRRLSVALGISPASRGEDRSGWLHVLDDQLPHLVGSLSGALVADDPSVVTDALDWCAVVLRHRGAPEETAALLRSALREAVHGLPSAARLLDQVRLP